MAEKGSVLGKGDASRPGAEEDVWGKEDTSSSYSTRVSTWKKNECRGHK